MDNPKRESLSARQAEIANLVVAGNSSREIAEALCLSPRTVEHHIEAIFNKLGVGSRVELVTALLKPGSSESALAAVPTLRSVDAIPNNLPRQLTSFIGREAEIADITVLVESYQLVTLVGSGGVGKTRTSLAVAEGVFGAFPDGVWFVEFAPLSRGEYIPGTVAQALGLTLAVDGDPAANLARTLKSKYLLLVFDNCEHLVGDIAKAVAVILNDCHKVKILATSREPLRVRGEAMYRVPSLSVPPAADSAQLNVGAALPYVAVALFVERAQAVDHRFTLTDENTPVVADICRRLDGIALAIELAAARMNMLSPQQLRDWLDERFRVLTCGNRDRLPRHQTLRALIDWSHDLLDEHEQRLFRRLSIFANGFTIKAAAAVDGGDELDALEVFDLLASLVDKSLVMAESSGDSIRYRLLESTRVYAAEKLNSAGERDQLESRHLCYFRDWFVELRREVEQLQKNGQYATFATELDDVRVSLHDALVHRELVDGAQLLAAIGAFCWTSSGLGRESVTRYEAFLAELPRSEPRLLAELATHLTDILMSMGRYQQAREGAVAAIGFARASGDGPILAFALELYAFALLWTRDFAAAERALREAEAIQGVSPLRRLWLADCRALLSKETGDLDLAARSFERLREEWRSVRFGLNAALATVQLADIEFRRRKYQSAVELLRDAVALARDDYTPASSHLPNILVLLGSVLAVSGAVDAATGPAIEAITLWSRRDTEHLVVMLSIELLSYIACAQGDLVRSARLAGYADASCARIGYSRDYVPQSVYELLITSLHERLPPDQLARLKSEGASLTAEAAIALARTLGTNPGTLAT